MITDGRMQYLYDERGRRYLDVRTPYHPPSILQLMTHPSFLAHVSLAQSCQIHFPSIQKAGSLCLDVDPIDGILVHMCVQAFAGIVTVSVGHCHPRVVAAVQEQSARLQHTTTIYLNNQIAEYAKELTDRLPGNLKVGKFINASPCPVYQVCAMSCSLCQQHRRSNEYIC